MHYEKGQIVLNTSDLDLVSQCPFSVTRANRFRKVDDCLRCSTFSEIARYCFKRSAKVTNSISDKRLKERYERILYSEGVGDEVRQTMVRSDGLILSDIIHLSKEYQPSIDIVEPDISINFGRFVVRDTLDAILCIQGQYYITKFMCEEHPSDGHLPLNYSTLAGSLWLREEYGLDTSGAYFIQFRSKQEPISKCVEVTLTNEQLKHSIQSVIDTLEPDMEIIRNFRNPKRKNKDEFLAQDFEAYKKHQLAFLSRSYGAHCWNCQEPTCIKP